MAFENRKENTYYYRKKRVGGKVVSVYVGAGEVGERAHQEDLEKREQRKLPELWSTIEYLNLMLDLYETATMLKAGYHRPKRGPWRKKNSRTLSKGRQDTKLGPSTSPRSSPPSGRCAPTHAQAGSVRHASTDSTMGQKQGCSTTPDGPRQPHKGSLPKWRHEPRATGSIESGPTNQVRTKLDRPATNGTSWHRLDLLAGMKAILLPSTRTKLVPLFSLLALMGSAFGNSVQDGIAASPEDAKPLRAGVDAPDSTVRGLDGKEVKLKSLLAGKPSVLIFYRGGWCPFCNAHLADLATIEGDIEKRGYQILALSPDTPEELAKTMSKDKLPYKLLSDSSAETMRKFGVAYRLDDKTFTMYRDKYHIDLEKSSGMGHHVLPVPSVFVVNKEGTIVFAHSNPDYKVRMKAAELLKALDDN